MVSFLYSNIYCLSCQLARSNIYILRSTQAELAAKKSQQEGKTILSAKAAVSLVIHNFYIYTKFKFFIIFFLNLNKIYWSSLYKEVFSE